MKYDYFIITATGINLFEKGLSNPICSLSIEDIKFKLGYKNVNLEKFIEKPEFYLKKIGWEKTKFS